MNLGKGGPVLLTAVAIAALTMRTAIKPGVVFRTLRPEMEPVIRAAREVFSAAGQYAEITEAYRASPGSKHAEDLALDYRVKHVPRETWEDIALRIAIALGPAYDVVLELDKSTPWTDSRNRSHIHIEYDPQPWKQSRSYGFSTMVIA